MTGEGHGGFFQSPGFVPLLTGSLLAMLSLWYTVSVLLGKSTIRFGSWIRSFPGDQESWRVFVIILITGIYAVGLLGRVHFFWATLFFHLCMFSFLRIGSPLKVAIYSLCASVFVGLLLPLLFGLSF